MPSSYHAMPQDMRTLDARRVGLTDTAVIQAYVNRRINDPGLISSMTGPSYADFFTPDNS